MNLTFIKSATLISVALNFSLYFFGLLRPTIFLDYLDNWFLWFLPLCFIYLNKKYLFKIYLDIISYTILIITFVSFPFLLFFNSVLLGNSHFSPFELEEFDKSQEHILSIDIDESLELSSYEGDSVYVDIINRPGNIGFPETINSYVGNPKILMIREMSSSEVYKTKGWKIKLNNETIWDLDLFSIDSVINLDKLNINETNIRGSGEVYLGNNLIAEDIYISGNFEIFVDEKVPIVVIGLAKVPSNWINATIGYLNNVNENYKFKIYISEGSEVEFFNGS